MSEQIKVEANWTVRVQEDEFNGEQGDTTVYAVCDECLIEIKDATMTTAPFHIVEVALLPWPRRDDKPVECERCDGRGPDDGLCVCGHPLETHNDGLLCREDHGDEICPEYVEG